MDREMQYECAGCHQRSYAQLGWPCGKDGLQRNLCEGSEMSRPSMVEMETAQLERSGERHMVWPTPTAVQSLQVGGHGCWEGLQICWKRRWSVENCPGQHGLVAFCSKPWKLEAILENVERALYRWSRVPRGPMRVRHGWGRCRCLCVGSERIWERLVWRAPGTPLSMSSQVGLCSDVLMVQCWL